MGKEINHIKIHLGVNSRSTKDIWQRACFKVSVNRTKFRLEKFAVAIAPSTISHANQEHETSAAVGEAFSGSRSKIGVSHTPCSVQKPSSS